VLISFGVLLALWVVLSLGAGLVERYGRRVVAAGSAPERRHQ